MNPYNFSVLFFAFCSLFIGILIWLKRADALGNVYFIFSVTIAVWGIGYAVMISPNVSYPTALFIERLSQGVAVFIPVTWFHLILLLTDRVQKFKKILIVFYIIAFVLLSFSLTPWFIPRMEPAVGFNHYMRAGVLYHIFPLLYFIVVPISFVLFAQKITRSKGEEAFQLKGFFIATLIGFVGGSFCFLPIYEIMVPQYGVFFMPIYPFVMAYFMMRHKLFDLEQIAEVFQREKLTTIGLLAASVNHEIRNPLYALKSLLESFVEDSENKRQIKNPVEVSKKALTQATRALEVITKLNRFAKPVSEVNTFDSNVSVLEAIKNVFDLISYQFELDKIKIDNQISNNLPLIQADQRQLEEILFNLIVNACHAMPNGGQLVIASKAKQSQSGLLRRPGGTPRNDGYIQIKISDTGTGISPEQAKHLFEPFYTTKGDKGTGLGLYITKQLVERNGGKISVKSEEGKGTSFVLEFKLI